MDHKSRIGRITTFFALIFFVVGFIHDNVFYFQNNDIFMLWVNLPLTILLIISVILLKWGNHSWDKLLIINYSFITLNLVVTMWYYLLNDSNAFPFQVFYCMYVGFIIVVTSTFTLQILWSYIYCSILCLSYIIAAICTNNSFLIENIFIIPFIISGTAFALHMHIRAYKKDLKEKNEYKNESTKLKKMMNDEKVKIKHATQTFAEKAKKSNINLSNDIKQLLKTLDNSLPEVILEHSEHLVSEENKFFSKLLNIYKELTSNDLKICYMLVCNMSTKEIAEATMCTYNSIKVSRSRLRKKLKLSYETNLVSYLKSIETEA